MRDEPETSSVTVPNSASAGPEVGVDPAGLGLQTSLQRRPSSVAALISLRVSCRSPLYALYKATRPPGARRMACKMRMAALPALTGLRPAHAANSLCRLRLR